MRRRSVLEAGGKLGIRRGASSRLSEGTELRKTQWIDEIIGDKGVGAYCNSAVDGQETPLSFMIVVHPTGVATGSSMGVCGDDRTLMEVVVDIIARFPARPGVLEPASAPAARVVPERADRVATRPAKPARRSATHHRDRREKSVFPSHSIVVLAVVAAGVWGLALRNELVRRQTALVELAKTEDRAAHRVASEPTPHGTADTRIAQ